MSVIELIAAAVIVIVLIGLAEKVTRCASTLSEIWEAYEQDRERLKDIDRSLGSIESSLHRVESSLDSVSDLLDAVNVAARRQLPTINDSEIRNLILGHLQAQPAQQTTLKDLSDYLVHWIHSNLEPVAPDRAVRNVLLTMEKAGAVSIDRTGPVYDWAEGVKAIKEDDLVSLSPQARQ